jgi:hypothetical protein
MPSRTLTVDGMSWSVVPSGLITQYDRDEFGLIFTRSADENTPREVRVTRYSPLGARSREMSLAELTDDQLRELLAQSQPTFTSPEARYSR